MAAIFIIRPLRTSHQMASSVSIPELWKRTWTHQNDETTLSIMNNPIFCMHLAWTLHLPTITSLPLLLNYQHVTHHHQCSPIAEPRFNYKKKKIKNRFSVYNPPGIDKRMSQIPWATIGVVTGWYSSNIGVLLLNKYLLSNYGFRFPVFLTTCHMLLSSLLSYVISVTDMVPLQSLRSQAQFWKIVALSVVFSFSVVCGNASLRFIPVSFNQAIGSTTPFFTAVFAYAVTSKREAWVTYATLLPVVSGVIIASGVIHFPLQFLVSFGFSIRFLTFTIHNSKCLLIYSVKFRDVVS